jgi:hypothetical protein
MRFEEHCNQCEKELGQKFEKVHTFLDQFAKDYGWSHRRIFHHKYGIEIVRYFMGDLAAEAAKLHIKADCGGEIPEVEDWLDANYWLNV